MNYTICSDRNNQVICWGDMLTCEKYISQMYSISLDNVIYDNYSTCSNYSSFYESLILYHKCSSYFLSPFLVNVNKIIINPMMV